jgi:hypothetical protein
MKTKKKPTGQGQRNTEEKSGRHEKRYLTDAATEQREENLQHT